MFPQINSLPGAERHAAIGDGDAEIHSRERGADMRGHVVRTFAGVLEQGITVRHKAGKKAIQIGAHIRIRVLLDEQGGRRVLKMQRHKAEFEAPARNPRRDFPSEIVQPASSRAQREFVLGLTEHGNLVCRGAGWTVCPDAIQHVRPQRGAS